MDVAAYLQRLRYSGSCDPTAATLSALHVAHLQAVPFENLSIHRGEPIVLDERALFEKVVVRRRGGFCYELNGLFAALLRELGFEVDMLSAGVMGASGEFGPEFDHMALRVRIGSDSWLADVGFGDSFREPLRLVAGAAQMQGPDAYELSRNAIGIWLLTRTAATGTASPQYRFTLTPRVLSDYEAMCVYHQTSPDSPFTRQRLCTIATLDGRVTLSGTRLIRSRGDTREEETLADDRRDGSVLRDLFGLATPP
jgi:N-hydroxyarylamine O-acetyltransferase